MQIIINCLRNQNNLQWITSRIRFSSTSQRSLRGVPSPDLLVESKNTVSSAAFDTGLIRRVAERAKWAVVSIYTRTSTPHQMRLLPFVRVKLAGEGLGSGFFIHPTGYLLTNDHVIRNAKLIRVMTFDGVDYGVTVVARDPVYDLALLKVVGAHPRFPVLPMGESGKVGVGDLVIAVGNPLGLGHTVTLGIISQTGRNLTAVSGPKDRQVKFIQTDTAINPGSSGGPLITLTGAWIGLNTAGVLKAQGIGFTVPSSLVRDFLDDVRAGRGEREAAGP